MGLSVSCVNCHRTVKVKSKLAGKTVRCPRCGSPVSVPTAEEPSLDRPSQARATPAPPSRRSSHEMAQRSASKSDAGQRVSGRPDAGQRISGKRDSGNYDSAKSGSGNYAATKRDSGKLDAAKPENAVRELDGDDQPYMPRLKRRRGPNVLLTALTGAWESVGERRREYAVGLAIVVALVALQLVYGGWFSSAKPSGAPVSAAEESTDNDEPPTKKVSVVIVDGEKKKDEPEMDADVKGTLKRTKASAGKDNATKNGTARRNAGRMTGGKRPAASAFGARQDPQRTLQAPGPAPAPKGPTQSTIPTVKTDHTGAYTAAAPPEVGEVVVVRLRDGLHVAKVASVDIAELQCEIIVLDAGAYHKRGQIKETSRTDTVRFGQMRPPTFLRSNRNMPPDFGPPAM